MLSVTRGDALRAFPWLLYSAPLALGFRLLRQSLDVIFRTFSALFKLFFVNQRRRVPLCFTLALAFILRAFGAQFRLLSEPPLGLKLLLLQKYPPLVHRSRSLELRSQLRPGGRDP